MMNEDDNSERGAQPSMHDDNGVTLDMGNTVSVMAPDQDVESSQNKGQPYSKKMVYLVIGLAVLAVIGIITLISVSVGYSKGGNEEVSSSVVDRNSASFPIADDSGNTNGGATVLPPPYNASVSATTVISKPDTHVVATSSIPATVSSETPDTSSSSYQMGCLTDRFDNEHFQSNNRLYPGQYICSTDDERRFQFGMTLSGNLLYKDTQDNNTTVLVYDNPYQKGSGEAPLSDEHPLDYFFTLRTDGTFVMNMINNTHDVTITHTLWTAEPKYEISLTENCLPHHDCPYLHVHQGGVMVLNWIGLAGTPSFEVGSDDNWQNHNFLKVYDFFKNKK